jgi:hypothetical protein
MKLPDFSNDLQLNALRSAMGAPLRQYTPPASTSSPLTDAEIEVLAREGMDIPLDEVQVLPDGTLAFKDRRVVLYIRDVRHYRSIATVDEGLPRFHIAECDKLKEMRANKRFERYVVATRDTGVFQINLMPMSGKFERHEKSLNVCQFCLSAINWNNFVQERRIKARRHKIVSDFRLNSYFERYGKTFVANTPGYTDETGPLNDYDRNFELIAKRIKQKRGYTCGRCGADMTEYKKYLHAHHINGLKYDNRDENLELLCVGVHAEASYHGHLKATTAYKEFLRIAPKRLPGCVAKAVRA